MSYVVTLAKLRQAVTTSLGISDPSGTFSSAPSGSSMIDTTRFDPDKSWDGAYIMDNTQTDYPIRRIRAWSQSGSTWTVWGGVPSNAGVNDAYELSQFLSFSDLRNAINNGISMCGPDLRTFVNDESQTLTANVYQYTPVGIWPLECLDVSYEVWTGQPTREFPTIPQGTGDSGWHYLSDTLLQLPAWTVNAYNGRTVRFSGFGPVVGQLTTNDPAQVIATFDDEQQFQMLVFACTYQACLQLAMKTPSGEQPKWERLGQQAGQNFQVALKNWARGTPVHRSAVLPVAVGGWSGY